MKDDSFTTGHETKSCLIQLRPEWKYSSAKPLFSFSSDITVKKAFSYFRERKKKSTCKYFFLGLIHNEVNSTNSTENRARETCLRWWYSNSSQVTQPLN